RRLLDRLTYLTFLIHRQRILVVKSVQIIEQIFVRQHHTRNDTAHTMTDNDAVFAGDILPRRVGFLISGIDELLDLITIFQNRQVGWIKNLPNLIVIAQFVVIKNIVV